MWHLSLGLGQMNFQSTDSLKKKTGDKRSAGHYSRLFEANSCAKDQKSGQISKDAVAGGASEPLDKLASLRRPK